METIPIKKEPLSYIDAAATLIDRKDVARRIGVKEWTLGRMIKSGRFPKPIRVSYNTYGWRLLDVAQWIEKQMRARHEPRPIVGRAKQLSQKVRERLEDSTHEA